MKRIASNAQLETPNWVELLEDRIAPAGLNDGAFLSVPVGSPILLQAGQGLATSDSGGSYLLYIEKGQALVFTTDLNANNQMDANEITGISAGNGLRFTSFVDIQGDIVTNLKADGTLTDSTPSDGIADGKVLLNSKIEAITLRSVTEADLNTSTTGLPVESRLALSSYSIYGNIFAGGGFGVTGGGLLIDTTGYTAQLAAFTGMTGTDFLSASEKPSVGDILVGTAASGQYFNFGITSDVAGDVKGIYGQLDKFLAGNGVAGADITGIRAGNLVTTPVLDPETEEPTGETTSFSSTQFSIGSLKAGDGGFGARGGSISNVALFGNTGTIQIIAGNGGDGPNGGVGGSILNLSDAGSNVGYALIQTGNGGEGLIGVGGNGGTLKLGEFKMAANLEIRLGHGGDGLTKAGNGSSYSGGTLAPDPSIGITAALKIVSSTHEIGQIGRQNQIDFDNDGFADLVYLSTDPQQLVVLFGSENGFDVDKTQVLNVPNLLEITEANGVLDVGDVNGDGALDIVVASNALTMGGLVTYMGDGLGEFSIGLRSALPFFNSDGFLRGPQQILDITLGDFDGDGLLDVGILSEVSESVPGSPPALATILYFARGIGEGIFFVDYAKDSFNQPTNYPVVLSGDGGFGTGKIQATVTNENTFGVGNNDRDMIVGINGKSSEIVLYKFYASGHMAEVASIKGMYAAIQPDPTKPPNQPVEVGASDFTLLDIGNDGILDVATINGDAGKSITLVLWDTGAQEFDQPYGPPLNGQGIQLTGAEGLYPDGFGGQYGIVAGNFDGTGAFDTFAVFRIDGDDTGIYTMKALGYENGDVAALDVDLLPEISTLSTKVAVFGSYRASTGTDPEGYGFVYAAPSLNNQRYAYIETTAVFGDVPPHFSDWANLSNRGLDFVAGDGGTSTLGNGGVGGSLTKMVFTIPANLNGEVNFTAGSGGNGGVNGGAGGVITSIKVDYSAGVSGYSSRVFFFAGDGGNGISGNGGAGGSITKSKTLTGAGFYAGDGGDGYKGGSGGSIVGAGNPKVFDNYYPNVEVIAGDGGNGIVSGGNGGSVSKFVNLFPDIQATEGGQLLFVAGSGGNAVAGRGGNGGSVVNSSPDQLKNELVGDIALIAGSGGFGLTGGNGGSITNFVNTPSTSSVIKAISVIAGDGGNGVIGNGGAGGSISGVNISGAGVSDPFTGIFTGQQFNRFIAGNGGDSFGAVAGNGGSISSLTTTAGSTSTAIAAGAGGDGLLRGGVGGSLIKIQANASESEGYKVLAIAGAGGSAYGMSVQSIAVDPKNPTFAEQTQAFGGAGGIAGNGGGINNFKQLGTTGTRVDLISGDGGSTVNYGKSSDKKFNVGKGGSITNVELAGYAGAASASDSDVEIKSYNDTSSGETVADFVSAFLLGDPAASLTNAVGNVGVVVGVSGNIAGNQASTSALNGSVATFKARGIMSMVAGSVDSVAAIVSISNLTLNGTNILGSYKDSAYHVGPYLNTPVYLDKDGNPVNSPIIGGKLVDGAIIAGTFKPQLPPGRVFVR